jgi:hypothetical protein
MMTRGQGLLAGSITISTLVSRQVDADLDHDLDLGDLTTAWPSGME